MEEKLNLLSILLTLFRTILVMKSIFELLSDQINTKVKCPPVWEYIRHLIPTLIHNTHHCHIASQDPELFWVYTLWFLDQIFVYTKTNKSTTATWDLSCFLIYVYKVYLAHMQIKQQRLKLKYPRLPRSAHMQWVAIVKQWGRKTV